MSARRPGIRGGRPLTRHGRHRREGQLDQKVTKADAVAKAAERLHLAASTGVPCDPIRDVIDLADVRGAYAVQNVNTELALEAGRRLVGRKIGLTSTAVQKQLGVNQPDFGMLFADMAYADGEDIPIARTSQPKVEAEIALVLGRDLDMPVPNIVDLIRATEFVLPAIEVVGSRIRDWDIRLVDTIADNASSGMFVVGNAPRRLDALDLIGCRMTMTRAGAEVSSGTGAACLGNPLVAAVWLARKMHEVGRPLKEGDIVLTGALGPMVPVSGPDRLEATIEGLGTVSVSFA